MRLTVIGGWCAALSLAAASHTHAAVLAYDGFNYAAGSALAGQSGGTGWGANAWATSFNAAPTGGSQTAAVDSAGLSFSDLVVTGNAFKVTAVKGAGSGAAFDPAFVAGRKIGTDNGADTTIWSSHLIRATAAVAGVDPQSWSSYETRVNGSQLGGLAGGGTTFFRSAGKRPNSNRVGVSAGSDASANDAGASISSHHNGSATFLIISRVSNLGAGNIKDAKLWMLTAANFDAIKAGGITEAELNATNFRAATRTDTATSTSDWDTTRFIQFQSGITSTGAENFTYIIDELRYATTLNEVVPVPEPASLAALGVGALALALRRRCR